MDKTLPDAVRRTDIDGVPCFWIDTGRPTLTVQLLFRHGMADEVAACSGWTHLVEHLALHGRGGGLLQVAGGRLARWAILARLAVAWLRRKIAPNALAGVVGLVGGALLLPGIITGIPTLMIAGVFVLARAASSVKG